VLQPTTLDLDPVVHGLEKMLHRLLGEDIELVVRTCDQRGMTHVDPGQLEQVIMNLVVNARDAMPGGGKLTIETANVELDELAATLIAGAPGPYVRLTVTDTGCGMDAATRARIFEPFYTTKEKGRGTGLGLSTCQGIIKQSGGYITVYSEVGLGTVFTVYLPRVDVTATSGELPTHDHALGGDETVLLIEDDEVVRTCVARMLQGQGYQVLAARGGDEAVAIAQRQTRQIDLVLSDVIMPRSSGPDVVARIQAVAPLARALYMSGYSDHAILRNGALREGLAFLSKPFDRDVLARKVREVLDASPREMTVARD
jgi:two-component system cell cycle sensor histidine kinase/response regulator CckA